MIPIGVFLCLVVLLKTDKTIDMKKLFLALLISTPFLMTSCNKNHFCISSDDNYVTEERTIENFDKIKLSTLANVQFIQSPTISLTIEASEKLIPYIRTNVIGGTLEISTKNNTCIRSKGALTIYVSGPNLKDLSISGSGNIMVNQLLSTNKLNIKISGSGNVDIDSLTAQELSANISGSGNIYAQGFDTLQNNEVKISGSGDIDFGQLISHDAKINISGSGNCKVNVIDYLNVKISGSGDVYYSGNPAIDVDISGSGSLKHD